ncbi:MULTISPECIES: aminotransferase class I/II-fold pyridoxal phosphate-dependent enzyme [Paenibacillus]|jgi:arginine/lysine/ornithine decarboxylase|uniref:Aminotransferase class I/II-fold pyridoxal phosphate-dependent enzyme n=2 Tax=Paenibacillus TaxID=44249 RepID=A0AAJ3MDQ6_PAEPO|nr:MULTISPECIES: aminotransferase class I/II-fold pyridoxal phosphate-dependent enzyme [Paenibacillus]ADM70795.1 arginine decarboxylase [Paenibacillus polymyxa E681]AIW40664.1 arginine decarboxylase [Paenibacillus polymyxa CR1]ALA42948.1 arginine decarboxylase [Paenibacillus peoriae]APB70601.1 aminotransferase class V-fold PLP-dependent enzyme [Paenibacillus polymyxa]APB75259.1 aminotransferase class V-fold PLP-dependent enzyme [Paenibacillus polymyxa]
MNQSNTPLFTALKKHAQSNPVQFHIPGHKKGVGADPEFREFMGDNAFSIDMINIAPLDDLHQPTGVIEEAQKLAADAFGADYTYYSVQGTSGAIITMIMSICLPGDKIIVPRNVHKSIMSAIIFAGAKPVFISPVSDENLGIHHGVTTKSVRRALERHPDAKGVLVINPTYYGVCADLKEIVDLAHSYNVPVLVDEAHGVLIHFHPDLPMSAMEAGADMSATSVHKLGGSLTQSSILNVNTKNGYVNPQRVQTIFSMLTTTSTSYLLLASLDTSRRNLALNGHEIAQRALDLAEYCRSEVNKIEGLYCFGSEILGTEATYDYDPTKITVHIRHLGLTGYDVENWLRDHYNIEVELSDMYNILCLVTPGDTKEEIEILLKALRELASLHYSTGQEHELVVKIPDIPQLSLIPRDAFYGDTEIVPFKESAGRIIAEFIYVYPPGIPILLPGEVISQDNIDYIVDHVEVGLPVKGPEDRTVHQVKVIVETDAIS